MTRNISDYSALFVAFPLLLTTFAMLLPLATSRQINRLENGDSFTDYSCKHVRGSYQQGNKCACSWGSTLLGDGRSKPKCASSREDCSFCVKCNKASIGTIDLSSVDSSGVIGTIGRYQTTTALTGCTLTRQLSTAFVSWTKHNRMELYQIPFDFEINGNQLMLPRNGAGDDQQKINFTATLSGLLVRLPLRCTAGRNRYDSCLYVKFAGTRTYPLYHPVVLLPVVPPTSSAMTHPTTVISSDATSHAITSTFSTRPLLTPSSRMHRTTSLEHTMVYSSPLQYSPSTSSLTLPLQLSTKFNSIMMSTSLSGNDLASSLSYLLENQSATSLTLTSSLLVSESATVALPLKPESSGSSNSTVIWLAVAGAIMFAAAVLFLLFSVYRRRGFRQKLPNLEKLCRDPAMHLTSHEKMATSQTNKGFEADSSYHGKENGIKLECKTGPNSVYSPIGASKIDDSAYQVLSQSTLNNNKGNTSQPTVNGIHKSQEGHLQETCAGQEYYSPIYAQTIPRSGAGQETYEALQKPAAFNYQTLQTNQTGMQGQAYTALDKNNLNVVSERDTIYESACSKQLATEDEDYADLDETTCESDGKQPDYAALNSLPCEQATNNQPDYAILDEAHPSNDALYCGNGDQKPDYAMCNSTACDQIDNQPDYAILDETHPDIAVDDQPDYADLFEQPNGDITQQPDYAALETLPYGQFTSNEDDYADLDDLPSEEAHQQPFYAVLEAS